MKKVLVIAYYFPPHGGGGVIRIHNFVKYLPQFEFLPVILTLKDDYYEKTSSYPELLREYTEEIKIIRTASFEPKARGIKDKVYGLKKKNIIDSLVFYLIKNTIAKLLIPDRSILWAPIAIRTGLKLLKEEKIDIILATSPPFSSNVIAFMLYKLSGIPYVLDYRDDWVGNNLYSKKNDLFRHNIDKIIERHLIKDAAMVLASTEESIELFKEKYPENNPNKFLYIPNGFDPEYFKVTDSVKDNDNKPGEINFVYTGSLTIERTPQFFLLALREILNASPNLKEIIKITFIGYAHYKHKEYVKTLGLEKNVKFLQNLSPEKIAEYLREKTDVCLLFQRDSEGGKTAIPGKMYEYIAAGKPILCMDDSGATTRFLENIGSGLNTKYDSPKEIGKLVDTLIYNYKKISKLYTWDDSLKNKYNRKNHTKYLASILHNIS